MQPGAPHLSVDYGTMWTQALLAWPGGGWEPLIFDNLFGLPSAAHINEAGQIVTGEAAWRHAATDPDGFVATPLTHMTGPHGGTMQVRGTQPLLVRDLVTATLREVTTAATTRAGIPVTDVRMVVPAGWEPQQRTWLRQAAYRAGLGHPRPLEAPIAAVKRWPAGGMHLPVRSYVLAVNLGAGCEATVLWHGPTGLEVISTAADPQAGAAAMDERLLAGTADPSDGATTARRDVAARLRTTRETLVRQSVVTVPMAEPQPSTGPHARPSHPAALPVLNRAGELAADALAAADLDADRLTAVCLIGGTAVTPGAAAIIGARLGVEPQTLSQPSYAAALGASYAGHTLTPAGA